MLRSFWIIMFTLLSGAAQAATILVWGDSLSAGFGLQPGEEWPALLQQKFERENLPHTVINLSLSGETSAGGRSRLPDALANHKPNIVILALGGNDALRGQKLSLLADNLREMIRMSHTAGAKVLLAGMQIPPNYGRVYTERFRGTYAEVARTENAALVPFLLDGFAEKPEFFQPDGIHPVAAAQSRIIENLWPILQPLLP